MYCASVMRKSDCAIPTWKNDHMTKLLKLFYSGSLILFLLQFVQTFYLAHNDHPRVLCFIRQYRQRHSEEDSPQHEIKAKSRSRSRSRSRDRDKHSSRSNRDREKDRRGDSDSRSHRRRSWSKGREKGLHKKSRSDQHRYELLHKLWLCVSYSNLGTRLIVQTPCRLPCGYFIKYWQVYV